MKKVLLILLLCANAHAEQYIIGGTEAAHQAPFYWWPGDTRLTQIYIAGRQVPPCNICRIEWYVSTGINPGTLPYLKIVLFETSQPEVGADFGMNHHYTNVITVYEHANIPFNPVVNTWFGFDLDRTYNYGGNAFVIFTTRTGPDTVGCTTQTSWSGSSGPYTLLTGDEINHVRSRHRHYLRITTGYVGLKPTSLGRLKAVYR